MDANGDFVVAYTRVTNGNNFDVFAKQYDANCNLLNVITVAATSGREYSPSIAMTPDGRFDITYELAVASPVPQDIFVNRYSPWGGLLGTSQIGPFAFGALVPTAPIATDNTGDAVLIYTKRDPSNAFYFDTEARRISPAGAMGAEIQVAYAEETTSPEFPTGIALQPNGGPGGSFAVSLELADPSTPTFSYNGYVAVVDGSNTLSRFYAFGPAGFGSSITAEGAYGFLLTYTSPHGSSYLTHIYGQRGLYF
jgi:hypothetical protein